MQFLLDFVDWFVNLFTSIYNFLSSFVRNIGLLLDLLLGVFDYAISFILFLPDWLQMFAALTLFVCLLYMILGRNAGGKK